MSVSVESASKATIGFDSINMPPELSTKLLRTFDVEYDTAPEKIDAGPISNAGRKGYMIIRKAGDNWYTVTNIKHQWFLIASANGNLKEDFGYKFGEVQLNFGKGRSDWWRIPVNSVRGQHLPSDVDSVRNRVGATGKMAEGEGILAYSNRVFLPHIRKKLAPVLDDIFDSIKKFPRNIDQYGNELGYFKLSATARSEALYYANAIENLLENGYNRKVVEKFLFDAGKLDHGWGSIPNNNRNFKKLIKEPNARARFAKLLLNQAYSYRDQFNEMKARVEEKQHNEA